MRPDRVRCAHRGPRAASAARGITLVELLVGIGTGLLIVAGAMTFLTGNLREHRSLLLESRLMQDLRTAADVITRDVRRSGYWGASADGVWSPGASAVRFAAFPVSVKVGCMVALVRIVGCCARDP